MEKRLTEFELPDGSTVIVQTLEPPTPAGVQEISRPDELASRASKTLEQAIDQVRPAIEVSSTKIRQMAEAADEIQVEFGITLSGEVGGMLVFAKAGAEANFGVTITWSRT